MLQYQPFGMQAGDTSHVGSYTITLDSIMIGTNHKEYVKEDNDLVLSGCLTVTDSTGTKTEKLFPSLVVRKGMMYSLTDQINAFNLRARLNPSTLDSLLPMDGFLKYEPLVFKNGETIKWKGLEIKLKGIDRNVSHPNYQPEEGDVAIQAIFVVTKEGVRDHIARPLFLIREGSPMNMKAFVPDLGLNLKLERIDPEKEEFYVDIAKSSENPGLDVEFAQDVPRNDYIVLEAILFPGINLFWAGSLIMLLGMFLGLYKRLRKA